MFDSGQFVGAKKPSKQSSANPLYSRINPVAEPISQETPEEEQWVEVKVPPQPRPISNFSNLPSLEERDLPAGRQGTPSPARQDERGEARVDLESQSEAVDDERKYFEHLPKPLPEETLLTWRSASRPFKKRNRQFYTTIATIVILISLILFFAGQFLPIAVVISIAFLSYVLSSVPPNESEKKITTYGIRVEDELYYWEEMGRFWFDEKYGSPIVQIEIIRFPGRLTLLMGDLKNEELEDILKEVLIKQKPEDTFFDKSANWLQEKIPLDNS